MPPQRTSTASSLLALCAITFIVTAPAPTVGQSIRQSGGGIGERLGLTAAAAAGLGLLTDLPSAAALISRRRRVFRQTRAPTRAPTRVPSRAPTVGPTAALGLLVGQELYSEDLPDTVTAGTLARFNSRLSQDPIVRNGPTGAGSLRSIFTNVVNPQSIVFRHVVRESNLTNNTQLASHNFFFTPRELGSMFVFHEEATVGSAFRIEVLAEDLANPTAPDVSVYNWSYTVDDLGALGVTDLLFPLGLNGTLYTNANLSTTLGQLAVGATYRLQGPAALAPAATAIDTINDLYFEDERGDITYNFEVISASTAVPDGDVLINPTTGSLVVSPTAVYNLTGRLIASDESGKNPAELLLWTFSALLPDVATASNGPNGIGCTNGVAVDLAPFDLAFTCDCSRSGFNGSNCETLGPRPQLLVDIHGQFIPAGERSQVFFHNRTLWALATTYLIAPLNVTNARTANDPAGTSRNLTYTLEWLQPDPPRKFFVDGRNGEMLVTIPDRRRRLTAQLIVSSPETESAVVANLTFDMRPADTANTANGPNGRDCGAPAQRRDLVEFDDAFTCDCGPNNGIFIGDNCDPAPAQQAAASESGGIGSTVAVGVSVGVLLLLILVGVLIVHNRRLARWKARQPVSFENLMEQLHSGGLETARDTQVPAELARSDLILLEVLGKGNFGEVTKGKYTTTAGHVTVAIDVAVKTLLNADSPDAREEFLREAAVTWHFLHKNVVQMHGVVTSGEPYLLVLELCENGELKSYLESDDTEQGIRRLFGFMVDIAEGMAHLASLHFVHRDLAVRNVLLDHTFVAKIADFGLGRDTDGAKYYSAGKTSNLMLPLRWSDPVSIESTKFSELTDVWSYGITCIEIFTQGTKPYAGWTNYLVIEKVKSGYRLPCPPSCPPEVYDQVIHACWLPASSAAAESPGPKRPAFAELVTRLESLLPVVEDHAQTESSRRSSIPNPVYYPHSDGGGGVPGYQPLSNLAGEPGYYAYAPAGEGEQEGASGYAVLDGNHAKRASVASVGSRGSQSKRGGSKTWDDGPEYAGLEGPHRAESDLTPAPHYFLASASGKAPKRRGGGETEEGYLETGPVTSAPYAKADAKEADYSGKNAAEFGFGNDDSYNQVVNMTIERE